MTDPHVLQAIREYGPQEAYRRLIARNDALIRGSQLDDGREIAAQRSAIHTGLAGYWVEFEAQRLGYTQPFALVGLGGTGRAEMTPCSDTDFALLLDEPVDGNAFLDALIAQTVRSDQFLRTYGFKIRPQPYNLDDVPALHGRQLNAFLDMRAVFDPHDLEPRFRDRIRATFDPFEHFLHVSRSWPGASCPPGASDCERLDRFDIKSDALRAFLAGVWTLGGPQFRHSREVYQELDDVRDLEAYDFLLRIRSFVHLRRGTRTEAKLDGSHVEDVLGFEDFESFGELLAPSADRRERFEFANHVRARLLAARRRVERFARGVIGRELQRGHKTSAGSSIVCGVAGLRHEPLAADATDAHKSAAALSLLLAAQQYGVAIDPAELEGTFRQSGDWLLRVPQLSPLFYETRGSLAATIEALSQIDGAMERLFPGYSKFEASLDERVLEERDTLRGVWIRQKLRALDAVIRLGCKWLEQGKTTWHPIKATLAEMLVGESALLDADHLAAVKLALVVKRLPETVEDAAARGDVNLPLHERFASGFSGIRLADYFPPYAASAGFSEETVRVAKFLVANRRTLKEFSKYGRNDESLVSKLVDICGDVALLRTLFVFTCTDRLMGMPTDDGAPDAAAVEARNRQRRTWWLHENSDARWFNTRELYIKTLARFLPEMAPSATRTLLAAGYGERERAILENFGRDFFSGQYVRHINSFASRLFRLVDDPQAGPQVGLLREGNAMLLGVAARDFRGLAACIAGALHSQNVSLSQAHLFSAARYQLALDFFHLAADQQLPPDLRSVVQDAVQQQRHISPADAARLPPLEGASTLDGTPSGVCCLRHETTSYSSALLYALTYKIFQQLGGSIHGLSAYTSRGGVFVAVHLSLPPERSLEQAREIVAKSFGG